MHRSLGLDVDGARGSFRAAASGVVFVNLILSCDDFFELLS